jgi:hypothetical protein
MDEPTYGVIASNATNSYYYLGNDEVLWDWTNAPVAFVDSLAEIPLPDGYVVLDEEDRIVKGPATLGITTVLVSSAATFDDKTYLLLCSMKQVSRHEFNRAGLSDERIIRSEIF